MPSVPVSFWSDPQFYARAIQIVVITFGVLTGAWHVGKARRPRDAPCSWSTTSAANPPVKSYPPDPG